MTEVLYLGHVMTLEPVLFAELLDTAESSGKSLISEYVMANHWITYEKMFLKCSATTADLYVPSGINVLLSIKNGW